TPVRCSWTTRRTTDGRSAQAASGSLTGGPAVMPGPLSASGLPQPENAPGTARNHASAPASPWSPEPSPRGRHHRRFRPHADVAPPRPVVYLIVSLFG